MINSNSLSQTLKVETLQGDILQKLAPLPIALSEVSGLLYLNDSILLMHNDSDRGSFLYFVTREGGIKSVKKIQQTPNYDWEDITSDDKFIYIGDIGNNQNRRKKLQIYKINKSSLFEESNIYSEKIEFFYEDQTEFPPPETNFRFDAEALVAYQDSLLIFTKNRSNPYDGFLYVYSIPKKPGNYKAILKNKIFLGGNNAINNCITGAAINTEKQLLILLSYDKIWIFPSITNSNLFTKIIYQINLNHLSQKEAICFDSKGNLIIADEKSHSFLGGDLYELKLNYELLEK